MKNRNWIYLLLILVCIGAFFGYRMVNRMSADTVAPEISVDTQLLEVSVQDERSALLQGVTAKDKRSGDVTASLVVESIRLLSSDGAATAVYAAFDEAGNVAKADREFRFTDYVSPRFSLSGPLSFSANSNFDIMGLISVMDAVDGDISHRIRATVLDESSLGMVGNHQVQFRVTNSLGETTELVLPVDVYSSEYQAKLELTDYLVYLKTGASFNPNAYLDTFTLNREETSLTRGVPEGLTLRTTGEVDTRTPGVYAVAYRITYERNNLTYTGYSKLIVVVEG